MNKQAFTFLTLLTLVVLLGVYYVTLPADNTVIEPDQLIASVQQSAIEQYNQLKNQLSEQQKEKNEQVISSSLSTSEEKLEAIQENTLLEGIVLFEENICSLLQENGFDECFVEKTNDIVRVVLPAEQKSQINAVKVIALVDVICDDDVLIEVSFE